MAKPIKPLETPKFTHDCEECIFLGSALSKDIEPGSRERVADLYFCAFEPTVIARFSDEGGDYSSGIAFGGRWETYHNPWLAEALDRARARDVIPDIVERKIALQNALSFLGDYNDALMVGRKDRTPENERKGYKADEIFWIRRELEKMLKQAYRQHERWNNKQKG